MEIERKFLVSVMPDLSGITPLHYERYYLHIEGDVEERIQKTNERYTYEKKIVIDTLTRSTELNEITSQEFEALKAQSSKAILRDSYTISPNVSIKIYHGEYKGLVRAEVGFTSIEEAARYTPEPWMGGEITNTPLGRDSQLLKLGGIEANRLLQQLS